MGRLSQCERIINYIKEHGSITVRQAEVELDINSPNRRLADLRDKGYSFNETWEEKKNSFGETVRYKVYRLKSEPGCPNITPSVSCQGG